MDDLVIPTATLDAQRRAADPLASAWVSANAGAGKTKVLTDRVVRLLLAGSPPGRILCLTFTKAAAANMAIRVFDRLGRWVTLDDEALMAELASLEGERPSRARLRLARTLFARAVETPGGLKIDTIHAFCERLLHLVPFEANVPARFAVLDESRTDEMREETTGNVLADATSGAYPDLAEALAVVSVEAAGEILDRALKAALRAKAFLHAEDGLAAGLARMRSGLGLGEDDTIARIEARMRENGIPADEWPAIARELLAGKATDQKRGAALAAAALSTDPDEILASYLSVFFNKDGTPSKGPAFLTKAVDAGLLARMLGEQARLAGLADTLKAARAAERTAALFTLAKEIDRRVEQAKMRLGALDFQDLIDKTLGLLQRGDAAWVLYKLDRGIDHVLIDEAQDTNPEQWEIMRRITEDFTAGHGAGGARVRTLFAVGDPKQSIYGFQGAAPQEFETTRRSWSRKVASARLAFEDVSLILSFRSAPAVLSAVDATFAVAAHYKGLSFDDSATGTVHQSARPQAPGIVELWQTQMPVDEEEPEAWVLPLDKPEEHAPPVAVARRVAQAVKCWTTRGDGTGRICRPGDVLVLVRKRGTAFEAVIRALKEAGVPVAGADRLNIGEHIAVLDLVAAGRCALLPDDDLTLAAALKSPLVGVSDDDLVRIAAGRADDCSLAAALTEHAARGDGPAQRACEALHTWKSLADAHGPFGFYASLLGPLGGRSRLVGRLGSEAGDAIDAFLCFAHQSELAETPSLTLFLNRFESAAHTIKRDLDSVNDEVRVMTVHGAKGLEAPVVVLIDGCDVLGRDPPLLPIPVATDETVPVWSPGKAHDGPVLAQARDALQAKGHDEHNRLLYVAMTRARDRLVIAPYLTGAKDEPANAWCEMVRRGLMEKIGGLEPDTAPYGPITIWREGGTGTPAPLRIEEAPRAIPEAPAWLTEAVAPEPDPLPPIRPSSALAAADRVARPGDGPYAPEARLRGTLVHALLERLPGWPAARQADLARAYVKARAPRLPAALADALAGQALDVLAHAALAPLFGPDSRAEAPLSGRVETPAGGVMVSGQIDRLVVLEHEVLVADFKTTAHPPAPGRSPPASHVTQLALYRRLLQDIYPGRTVRAFLIWTSGPVIHEVPDVDLDLALSAIKAA